MTERAVQFATLIRKPASTRPDAFDLAAQLTAEDRSALAGLVTAWLGGERPTQRQLLSYVREEDWPTIVATAARLAADGADDDAKERGFDLLDEAARQFPETVRPHLEALGRRTIEPWRLRAWTRDVTSARTQPLHLAFARRDTQPRFVHPTQGPARSDAARIRFGGESEGRCGFCHGMLHHLITLEPGVGGVQRRLEVGTCLTCLGWEQPHGDYALSFHHDASGAPTPIDRLDTPLVPQFPTQPYRALSVPLFDAGPRFAIQSWGSAARGQNLHRLLGEPTWVQDAEIRDCIGCATPMRFLLQLDSELPQEGGRTFAFGSGGVLFVQLCDACYITTMFWQCT